jgi:hypothetical protein
MKGKCKHFTITCLLIIVGFLAIGYGVGRMCDIYSKGDEIRHCCSILNLQGNIDNSIVSPTVSIQHFSDLQENNDNSMVCPIMCTSFGVALLLIAALIIIFYINDDE